MLPRRPSSIAAVAAVAAALLVLGPAPPCAAAEISAEAVLAEAAQGSQRRRECEVAADGTAECSAAAVDEEEEEEEAAEDAPAAAAPAEGGKYEEGSQRTASASSSCNDTEAKCQEWADLGECISNAIYMLDGCPRACGACKDSPPPAKAECDEDLEPWCEGNAKAGMCVENPAVMLRDCRRSCGTCINSSADFGVEQEVVGDTALKTRAIVNSSLQYMREVKNSVANANIRECVNKDALCSYWASVGECAANPSFMNGDCAPACQTCYLMDLQERCPMENMSEDALKPGDLDRLFEGIVADGSEYARYGPKVLSRPLGEGEEAGPDFIEGPWLVTFEDFTTDEEIERLIHWGGSFGYERSSDVGKRQADGTYDSHVSLSRTSENTWCSEDCKSDPLVAAVMERVANITSTPLANSEDIQLLRYEPGQYYREHHDYIEHHLQRPCGVRTLTLFLYLNDVEEGGGTRFNKLDLEVQPRRGGAVLWPSVLSDDPHKKDDRTMHEAMPVIKGVKYGANVWVHMNDFQDALLNNCV